MDEETAEEFEGAIVYCPVCATNDDAYRWGVNEMTCTNCETEWTVDLVPERVHAHSMVG